MKWLDGIKLALQIVAMVPAFVKSLEEALPMSGAGSEKLALFKEMVGTVVSIGDAGTEFLESIWDKLEKLVSYTVGLFNNLDVFEKKSDASTE